MTRAERLLRRAENREESARDADAAATVALADAERSPVGSGERLYCETCAEINWAERNHNNEMARMYRKAAEKLRGLE